MVPDTAEMGNHMYIVVNNDGKYFTNDWRSFEGEHRFLWTSHKKLAKLYSKVGWAENAARRVGGQTQQLTNRKPRYLLGTSRPRSTLLSS